MSLEALVTLMTAAVALMASPGPVTLSAAAAGAAYRERALPYVMGMSSGTTTIMVLVAAGIAGLLTALPGAAPLIAALSGAYFIYLAWRIATAPPVAALGEQESAPPFLGGYALGIANPKAYAAVAALFSGFPLLPQDPIAGNALKVVILSAFALTVNVTWMSAGVAFGRAMRGPRASRALNVVFAVLLLLSVLAMIPR